MRFCKSYTNIKTLTTNKLQYFNFQKVIDIGQNI